MRAAILTAAPLVDLLALLTLAGLLRF